MEHYENLVNIARHCQPGNLTVVLRIEFKKNAIATVLIDEDTDKLYTRKYRTIEDSRNLKIDFSGYMKLKEASKRIKVS
jgi:hypothetical protein